MHYKNRLIAVVLLLAVIVAVYSFRVPLMRLFAGASVGNASIAMSPSSSKFSNTAASGQAMPVETALVEQIPFGANLKAVGTLLADESVMLRPEISGRVMSIGFQEGSVVEKGQLLIALDDSLARAELREAAAARDLSRGLYQRAEVLFERGTGTANARDDNKLKLSADEARVSLAEAKLAKTRLVAPFSGVIGIRHVSVGDYVAPGQDLVGLVKIDPLKLDFRVPETWLAYIKPGQSVTALSAAFPGQGFTGEIYAIDPQIDVATRSITVRAYIPNPEGKLRPGIFAEVDLISEDAVSLVVPEQAIITGGGSQSMFKVVDGKAVLTNVKTGLRRQGKVQILDGVMAGDRVVIAGQLKLRDGVAVQSVGRQGAVSAEQN